MMYLIFSLLLGLDAIACEGPLSLKEMPSCQVYVTHADGLAVVKKMEPEGCAELLQKNEKSKMEIVFKNITPKQCLCIPDGEGGIPVKKTGKKVECNIDGERDFEFMCYGE